MGRKVWLWGAAPAAVLAALVEGYHYRTERAERSYSTAAIVAIKKIQAAETQYYSRNGFYAGALQDLALPPADLAGAYDFRLTAVPGGYELDAWPKMGTPATGSFHSDQTLTIRPDDACGTDPQVCGGPPGPPL